MFADKLLILATELDTVAPENFNYNVWIHADNFAELDFSLTTCGTVACALGHAVKLFPNELCWRKRSLFTYYIDLQDGQPNPDLARAPINAAMVVFGLTRQQAEYLFISDTDYETEEYELLPSPGGNASPAEVADHIRRCVKLWS